MPVNKTRSVLRLVGFFVLPVLVAVTALVTQCASPGDLHIQVSDDGIHAKQVIAAAGHLSLVVDNVGTTAHQLIVLRTNLAPAQLKMASDQRTVDLAASGQVMGRVDDVAVGQSKPLHLQLQPGHYVLLCNQPDHYRAGVYMGLLVE